ncbi:enoyl-CoA hydratase/isomerase [Hyphomonas sp. FCG-A18]|uniref:enoyl-CoA hydratase/isomerase n=1 Tax=Hyphomonas sp. FCG-A18 TaxID=3080019 RepID=UPI002B31C5FE|nr:enoyl-CoA hydratase/isomerase [Hyphomonas sp. FCG-A18]
MAFTKITYAVAEDIATISLNDPKTMNAAGIDTVSEMSLALEMAGDEARCTIITGTGRGFCSGANLSPNMSEGGGPKGKPDAGKALDSHYNPLIKAMRTHPHPIITAVNGAAAGVGCSIALMGDFIIAGESGYFLQAFRRIGLVPDGGSTFLLPRMAGRARAMEMTLFGEKVFAKEALEWGLINRVVADDALMDEARAYAQKLADGPTQALSLIRDLVWQSEDNDFDSQLQAERFAQRTAGRQPDFKEGVTAFLEKRSANFRGV